jgi:methyl-accepting chemotaxis protein
MAQPEAPAALPLNPTAGESLNATIHNFNDRLQVIENNAIPVAAGPGGAAAGGVGAPPWAELAAQIAATGVQMAEMAAQIAAMGGQIAAMGGQIAAMGGQIARLSSHVDNGFARTTNSHASRNADELVTLVNDLGAQPPGGFPATFGAFRVLASAPLNVLLDF